MGIRLMIASTVVNITAPLLRTANARTVTTEARITVISHDRPSSVSRRKRPNCAPNSAFRLTCGLNDDRKVRKATTPLVMVRVAAPAEAISSATVNGFP
ncbi:hypothetical protein J7E68_18915, partial [Microbacterium sp. ISL-103]|nr:hypothetical protein [Microbacterium sp. ISL-103]